jgi:rhodanese-related sulfurtransferase
MKNAVILLFLISSLAACTAQTKNVFKKVDVTTFKKGLTNKDVQLIDVRTPEEFRAGHIENAILIDYYSENFKTKIQKLDKEKPVYVYCKSGYRSGNSAIIFRDLGFKKVVDLDGGYDAWSKQ